MTHTATPWRAWGNDILADDPNGDDVCVGVAGKQSGLINLLSIPRREEIRCNAAFIVKAVNAHDELVQWANMLEKTLVYNIKKLERAGDDEGVRLQSFTLAMVRETLAKVQS